MKKENIILLRLIGSFVGVTFLMFVGIVVHGIIRIGQNIPIHATLESITSVIALFLAVFLFKFDNENYRLTRFHFAALALISIGVFDLFHAMSLPGYSFIWLHTIGTLIGSFLFLGVFFSNHKRSPLTYQTIPLAVATLSIIFALLIADEKDLLPPPLINGHFSPLEMLLNNVSAFLFLIVSFSFASRYLRERQREDLYFLILLLLLSSASFLFQFSQLWGATWWFWHFLRLGAYLFVLLFFIGFIEEKNKSFISREIQSNIVEYSADAIITKSLNNIVLTWNRSAEILFGYKAEEIIGQSISIIFLPNWEAQEAEINRRILEGSSFQQFETVYVSQKGENLNVAVTISPLKDSNGVIIGISKIIRDITDKKRAEEEIRTLNAKLEQKVIERTAALQNAYDEMEAFTYSVSHDLRSPLRATDGFSQALLEDYGDKFDDTAQDYLSRIRSASQKMAGLIDDLLQLSRQTRTAMAPSMIDLGIIARQITAELSRQNPERDVEIIIDKELNAYADANLMHIALDNLLGNAWKYTSQHPHARIQFGSKIENGEKIFYVKDDGAGFDMEYVDKLFKPFQRLHTVQEFAGNGIGLAMVYRIIKRHLGRAWAESEIEKGTTIYFALGLSESIYQKTEEQS